MNLMPYVWIFFAIVFGGYAIFLFANYDKVIPESFKKNYDHPFYESWRMLAGSGFLVVCAGNILFAMSEYQTVVSTYFTLRVLGVIMWAIGFTIVYLMNKKALRLFQPGFYKEYDEYKEKKRRIREEKKRLKKEKKNKSLNEDNN